MPRLDWGSTATGITNRRGSRYGCSSSSQLYLLGVDDDDVVAHVLGRCVGGGVLAADVGGDQAGEAPEGLSLSIDNVPAV